MLMRREHHGIDSFFSEGKKSLTTDNRWSPFLTVLS
jgi:hypothetical protein